MIEFKFKIAFVIVLILVYILSRKIKNDEYCNNILSGLWEADPGFCQEAELERFYIYLDTCSGRCWIVISNDMGVICNSIAEFSLSSNYTSAFESSDVYFKEYNITFTGLPDYLEDSTFPRTQTLRLYPSCGKLSMNNSKKLYFAGYKNNMISDRICIDDI